MSATTSSRRWLQRGLVVVVLGTVAGAGWYYQQLLRPEWHKQACKSHLKQLLTALHSYHDKHFCFPPAYTLGPDGERWHSWRVRILPQLGEDALYAQYRFDEPWNSPHNSQLANRMPAAFGYPGERHAKFLAVVGRVTAWPEHFSSRMRDFTDGTSNTVLLVESSDSTVNWLEPRDISLGQVLKRHSASSSPRHIGRSLGKDGSPVAYVGLADGAAPAVSGSLGRDRLGSLMTPCNGEPTLAARSLPDTPHSKSELPRPNFPPQKDATQYALTDVWPHAASPIADDRNYLYCCTFRMAWDELRTAKEPQVKVSPKSLMAAVLNGVPFPSGQLDPESCLTMVRPFRRVSEITHEMTRRFPGAAGPTSPPSDAPGVVVFAYLRKSLTFATVFDVLDKPLSFPHQGATQKMAAFGRNKNSGAAEDIASQVRILDYLTDDDFIVELVTESKRDAILLAKVPPEATLQQTIDSVGQRIKGPNPLHLRRTLEPPEDLAIPKLSFNVLAGYSELVGLIVRSGPEEQHGLIIKADQGIAFLLNERGAELESFAEIGIFASDGDEPPPPPPPKIRHFVFDKPFLVLLRESQATELYFALWVANTELMEPFDK